MNLCVIPARGGSKRLPGKNIKVFYGKPVIWYSLDVARRSELFDHILISTDDDDIADWAWSNHCGVHIRSEESASDTATDADVIREVLKTTNPDYLCYLYPIAPLTDVKHLEHGYRCILNGPTWKTVCRGPDGRDAGAFYWIDAQAFDYERYYTCATETIYMEEVQDVNTIEDWAMLEEKYGRRND